MSNKKKIAILCMTVGVCNRGGENFVVELTKELSKWFSITIYSTGIIDELEKNIVKIDCSEGKKSNIFKKIYEKNAFINYLVNRSIITYFLHPVVLRQRKFSKQVFEKCINKEKYDIIIPVNGVWGAYYSKKLRNKVNTPFIYAGHGGIGPGEKLILRQRPNRYIALSHKQLEWANKYYNKCCMIYNGVNVSKFRNENVEKNQGYKLIVSAGALDNDFKRHYLTIEALENLPYTKLLILGAGKDKIKLENLAKKLLPNRCDIIAVEFNDMPQYYNRADLFVLPSLGEPFGIVYVEAMAANLPIVAPNDEVRKEIIGNAGVFCNVENSKEYSEAIEKALKINWGDKPYKRSLSFDYSIIGQQYKKLIEDVVRENSPE